MTLGCVEISGGALLIWALLYYIDIDGVTPMILLSCLLHELGHCLAIHLLGGQVNRLRLTFAGAELRLSAAKPLSPRRMMLVALAGPAANLLSALTAAALARRGVGSWLYFFAGLNLGLAVFNLLPAGWLDGGRLLREGLSWLGREELGEAVIALFAWIAATALLGLGGALFWHSGGRNFTLLLAGVWMLWGTGRRRQGRGA